MTDEDGRKKILILDANVLLHDPMSLFKFTDNEVVVPLVVIEEIDLMKKREDEVGRNARETARILDSLRKKGKLNEGIRLDQGGVIRVEINSHDAANDLPAGLDRDKADNRILAIANKLKNNKTGRHVCLISKDTDLRIKADALNIQAEDLESGKVNYEKLYRGWSEFPAANEEIQAFYHNNELNMNGRSEGVMPNQFLILKSDQPKRSALGRFENGRAVTLKNGDKSVCGIKARNKEQKFALELLLNDKIKIVTLVGKAGTGKTLLAIAAGLDQVLEGGMYQRLLVTRPIVPMGNELGFLPGNLEEKIRPWMQPIYDNLDLVAKHFPQEKYDFIRKKSKDSSKMREIGEEKSGNERVIEHFQDAGFLAMEALTHIRGRSIPRQFIICDEAQQLTPKEIKTIVTRVGEGSKLVFTGDPEQIDNSYLDSASNGLTYLVERMKTQAIVGHVLLIRGERSEVAELGAQLL